MTRQRPNGLWPAVGDGVCGREFLGECHGGQHADDFGGRSRDIRCFPPRSGSLPATGGFVACPFEVPTPQTAKFGLTHEVRLGRGFQIR